MVPAEATSWAVVRPRALFEHPRLGRALARAFDEAGDEALFQRARRVGYDVRTVEQALVAWSARSSFGVAQGSLDTRRIEALLWEHLLPPRRRSEHEDVLRVEGTLGREPVALHVWNNCALITYAEGPMALRGIVTREVETGGDVMARWHGVVVPAALRERAPEALIEAVHDVDVAGDVVTEGARVVLRLEGVLPVDAVARARRAVEAFAQSPLGGSIGATQWAQGERVAIEAERGVLTLRAVLPWVAVDALAEVLRGEVGSAPTR